MESGASSFPGVGPGAPIRAGWVTLEPEHTGEVPLRGWWAQPLDRAPRGGLLVFPEVFGVNPWVCGVADRLAGLGYGALVVPLFARTAPELCLGYGPRDLQEGRAHKERTTAAELLLDGARALRWLRARLPADASGATGCLGFCFGGHVALLASGLEGMAASCVCYGAGVVQGRPGGGPPTLEVLEHGTGRVLLVYGEEDPLVPPEDLQAIGAAVERARAARGEDRVQWRTFAAGHGFLCEARPDFQPEAAAQAWAAILAFFAAHLPPRSALTQPSEDQVDTGP
ncbi:MAG: dienelactone hydrolase family protein [Cyanobacteriota bacterium]|nr:dienelactone hydrolase family protein [Cyanobacteriota bacterium]